MAKRVYSSVYHPEPVISKAYRAHERRCNLSVAQVAYDAIFSNLRRCFEHEDHFMIAQLIGISLPALHRILDNKWSPRGVVVVSILIVLMDLGYDEGIFESKV